jgi:hypothetical protein
MLLEMTGDGTAVGTRTDDPYEALPDPATSFVPQHMVRLSVAMPQAAPLPTLIVSNFVSPGTRSGDFATWNSAP